ncbi:N-acetylglucosamine kinase [Paenibacillus donghaensis]|uniref:ATPase n=1 Tax=Paenibacillus donghaensis TaxID=414771 RepID=A0A2Z2K420_9BACL|nr:BadF/BadG/BcrA/BcrD ATPase family protein [Paenibacillus donghaensis]ASA20386.1 ATPase [Paenibacillus donghaensis]
MNYYLGIDGGGSKTLAVISDEAGRIIGRAVTGCGNHQAGAAEAEQNIRQAVDEVLRSAGLAKDRITYSVFGLAGADREADFLVLRPMIACLGLQRYHIVCDTVIGLRAGTRQSYGAVVICGTGTNAYGINRQGEELQVGGFGYAFGDFGGGGSLAVEVFRSVIRAWEGRERPTRLSQVALAELGFTTTEEMFHHYLDHGMRVPNGLAKLLFEVAEHDEIAREILRRQGRELGIAASAVIRKLGMQQDSFDLVMAGSILTRGDSRYIVPYIEAEVASLAPGCRLTVLGLEPVAGALYMAMESSGCSVEEPVYEALDHQLSVKAANVVWIND